VLPYLHQQKSNIADHNLYYSYVSSVGVHTAPFCLRHPCSYHAQISVDGWRRSPSMDGTISGCSAAAPSILGLAGFASTPPSSPCSPLMEANDRLLHPRPAHRHPLPSEPLHHRSTSAIVASFHRHPHPMYSCHDRPRHPRLLPTIPFHRCPLHRPLQRPRPAIRRQREVTRGGW
jgi:hypothetical protein